MMNQNRKFDLEDRLLDFSTMVIKLAEKTPSTRTGLHLSGQLIRSSSSVSLNYGEAQSAESRKDFIHKMKIILKELRESRNCMILLERTQELKEDQKFESAISECVELISIFNKSIQTARAKLNNS